MPDEIVEIRVQHRLAAAEGHDRRAERGEVIDAGLHQFGRYWGRNLVVLVAVAAIDVASGGSE